MDPRGNRYVAGGAGPVTSQLADELPLKGRYPSVEDALSLALHWMGRAPEDNYDRLEGAREYVKTALASLRTQPRWQPIETAPHSGVALLLYMPWKSGYPTVFIGHYANGWVVSDYSDDPLEMKPTHWQPLPAAPGVASPQERLIQTDEDLTRAIHAPATEEQADASRDIERKAVMLALNVISAAWHAMDNCQEDGTDGPSLDESDHALLCKALENMEKELPDEPGYVCDAPAKFRYAVRALAAQEKANSLAQPSSLPQPTTAKAPSAGEP